MGEGGQSRVTLELARLVSVGMLFIFLDNLPFDVGGDLDGHLESEVGRRLDVLGVVTQPARQHQLDGRVMAALVQRLKE